MRPTGKNSAKSGQALIMLLVLMVVAIVITSAAIIINIINSEGINQQSLGQATLDVAESGTENALIRLLRDPNFTGETVQINGGISTSTVSGTTTKTITTDGHLGPYSKKIQVTVSYNNNILNILTWTEISP